MGPETEGKADGEDRIAEPERRGAGERERNEVGRRTRMTARSFSGAVPITVPAIGRLCTSSLNTTVTRVVPSTTWLFVRMIPLRSSTITRALAPPPPNVWVRTLTHRREDARDGIGERAGAIRCLRGGRLGRARLRDGDRLRSRRCRRGSLVVPAAAGERRRRSTASKYLTAASGTSRPRSRPRRARAPSPPARNTNVTSCLRFTWLTSDPILSYASRRSPTLSAS